MKLQNKITIRADKNVFQLFKVTESSEFQGKKEKPFGKVFAQRGALTLILSNAADERNF